MARLLDRVVVWSGLHADGVARDYLVGDEAMTADLPTVEDALAAVEWVKAGAAADGDDPEVDAILITLIEGHAETLIIHKPKQRFGPEYVPPEPDISAVVCWWCGFDHAARDTYPCIDARNALRSLAPLVTAWKEATGGGPHRQVDPQRHALPRVGDAGDSEPSTPKNEGPLWLREAPESDAAGSDPTSQQGRAAVSEDWKTLHANEAEKVLDHQVVKDVMAEFAENMGFKLEGLPRYGLTKVVTYAAQIARAQALGFNPDLLRVTASEARSNQLWLAAEAVFRGVPTFVIEAEGRDADDR